MQRPCSPNTCQKPCPYQDCVQQEHLLAACIWWLQLRWTLASTCLAQRCAASLAHKLQAHTHRITHNPLTSMRPTHMQAAQDPAGFLCPHLPGLCITAPCAAQQLLHPHAHLKHTQHLAAGPGGRCPPAPASCIPHTGLHNDSPACAHLHAYPRTPYAARSRGCRDWHAPACPAQHCVSGCTEIAAAITCMFIQGGPCSPQLGLHGALHPCQPGHLLLRKPQLGILHLLDGLKGTLLGACKSHQLLHSNALIEPLQ